MQVLSLKAHTLDDIPNLEPILSAAKSLLEEIPNWRQGNVYHGVKTASKKSHDSAHSWFSRTSTHPTDQGNFEEFWKCLGVNHSLNEKEYIPEIQSANLLGTFGSFEGWSLGYKFTPPVSDRIFTFLIATVLEEGSIRQGYVISLPLDVSSDENLKAKEPKGVRGRYVSIERVREIDNQVEWTMATVSDAGGLIPTFLSESQMPSKISEDVPHVLEWLKKKRETSA